MCSEYNIYTSKNDIDRAFGHVTKNLSVKDEWKTRSKLSAKVPVIGFKEDHFSLTELTWLVRPFPNSRLSQLESTKKRKEVSKDEDQIVRIYEVPMWKAGFEKFPCLVPMTSLFEPAYWGEKTGKVVEFSDPHSGILFVSSILIRPQTPPSQKLDGVSLLTHTASDQMLKFHHRLLMFLRAKDAAEYLQLGEVDGQERFKFLMERRYVPEFKVKVDRTMAPAWKKRVDKHENDLVLEMKYLEALKKEGVPG